MCSVESDNSTEPTAGGGAVEARSTWIPGTGRAATAWLHERLAGFSAATDLTGEQEIAVRWWYKHLRAWDHVDLASRRSLWSDILRFLTRDLGVVLEEGWAPEARNAEGRPAVKALHELRPGQRAGVAVRMKAAKLLRAGATPAAILERLLDENGVRRSRAWVYRVQRRIKEGDLRLMDRRTSNHRPRVYGTMPRTMVELRRCDPLAKPGITMIHRSLQAELREAGQEAPSRSWVRDELRRDPQRHFLRELGATEYRRRMRPLVPTRDRDVLPGELYEIDSTELDLWVRVMDDHGDYHAIRPSLTIILDVGSRAIVGMHLTLGAVSEKSVVYALIHALLPKHDPAWPMHGKPKRVRLDRGAEYGHEFRTTVEALGVVLENCPPYYPDARAKGERFFGTLNTLINSLHGAIKALGTGDAKVARALPALLTPTQLLESLHAFITGVYHTQMHKGINAIPLQVWRMSVTPTPVSTSERLALLPNVRSVKVSHGMITLELDRKRYMFAGTFLQDWLGARVRVRWGESLESVFVFDAESNRFLGEAMAPTHPLAPEVSAEVRELRATAPKRLAAIRSRIATEAVREASMSPRVADLLDERADAATHAEQAMNRSPEDCRRDAEIDRYLQGEAP